MYFTIGTYNNPANKSVTLYIMMEGKLDRINKSNHFNLIHGIF